MTKYNIRTTFTTRDEKTHVCHFTTKAQHIASALWNNAQHIREAWSDDIVVADVHIVEARVSVNAYYESKLQPIGEALDLYAPEDRRRLPEDFYIDEGFGDECKALIDDTRALADKFADHTHVYAHMFDACYQQLLTWYYS